jgi:hypothetical protein
MFPIHECYCTFDVDTDEMKIIAGPTDMVYIGDGKWKCPKCGYIEDLSDIVYNLVIEFVEVHEEDCVYVDFKILPCSDSRILTIVNGEDYTVQKQMEEDFWDDGLFRNHPLGIFKINILYIWYRCSYEYNEWDVDIELISEEKIA